MKMIVLLMVAAALHTCQPDKELWKEAIAYNKESKQLLKDLKDPINELVQKANRINVQGRALSKAEMGKVDAYDLARAEYEHWVNNMPKLPKKGQRKTADVNKVVTEQKAYRDALKSLKRWVGELSGQNH